MRTTLLVAVCLFASVGCGGNVFKKAARNQTQHRYSSDASCPPKEVKTDVLDMKYEGDLPSEADVEATGCGKTEVYHCRWSDGWSCKKKG